MGLPAPRDLSYAEFITQIKRRFGLDLTMYKQEQMQRRLRGSLERSGARSYSQFLGMIDSDGKVREAFLDRLTINVSELFRNPSHFDTLASRLLPDIVKRRGTLQIWSAGCSYGAEAVSLAILVKEHWPNVHFQLLASDIDQSILSRAAQGRFAPDDLKNVGTAQLARWFAGDEGAWKAKQEIMASLRFARHDLLKDHSPGTFDLIAYRNVAIYFSDEAKAKVNRLVFESLRPGGVLFIGATERIADYEAIGFQNPLPFFYLKPH